MFSVYVNSSQLTTRVEYFAIIRSRLIAECFVFIFYFNATAADMKKFRVSAYRRINTVVVLLYLWQCDPKNVLRILVFPSALSYFRRALHGLRHVFRKLRCRR